MDLLKYFSCVYIRIDDMYDESQTIRCTPNMMTLIREVAKVNPEGDAKQLYNEATGKVNEGATKAFIVHHVNLYICGMREFLTPNENMANFASLKQLKKLINAFKNGKRQVSAYGLVYLYVIYALLEGKSDLADSCANYIIDLYKLVHDYFEEHDQNELVAFFCGCYEPIIAAVRDHNTELPNDYIPPRPRKHPMSADE